MVYVHRRGNIFNHSVYIFVYLFFSCKCICKKNCKITTVYTYLILYNVRVTGPLLITNCMCYATEDAVQIGNWFIYNLHPHVTTITQNDLLCCVTFTQLTILHANIPFSHSLHNTLQIKPSHFETLAKN
jgi:hypothetical protein